MRGNFFVIFFLTAFFLVQEFPLAFGEADIGVQEVPQPPPPFPSDAPPPPDGNDFPPPPAGYQIDGSASGDATNVQQSSGSVPATVTSSGLSTEPPEGYQSDLPGRVKFNPRLPKFQQVRPQWAFQMDYGFRAFGGNAIRDTQSGNISAAQMMFEFQPAFLQAIGVIGFGPSFTVYPVIGGDGTFVANLMGLWSVGGQIRYQARFFDEQIVVPTVGFAFEQFRYQFADDNSGYVNAMGPFFGLWLYLNPLDRRAAADFYADYKGTRSYLVAEARMLSAADDLVTLSGMTIYVGFRLEFE